MPDPLMDTLDEIDRKSGKSGTFLLSPRVTPCNEKDWGTLLVTEGTSLHVFLHVLKIRAINLKSHLRYFKGFNNCYIWL